VAFIAEPSSNIMKCILLSTFFCVATEGAVLRGQSSSQSLTSDAYEVESEDRSFLFSQLQETESELVKLQKYVETFASTGAFAGLQLSAGPAGKNATSEKVMNKTSSTPKGGEVKNASTASVDPAKILASLGGAGMKLQGSAALAPMLAMLKGMYEDSKNRISQVNAREEKSKKWFADKEAEHAKRMTDIDNHFKNHKLSEELHTNETRDETRYFNYWSRVRERQHRQFHTNLKIQHAMMAKSKKMVEMYENTLSGKAADQEKVKKQLGQAGMPEIVFLQNAEHVVTQFCRESLSELHAARAEMSEEGLE